MSVMSMVLAGSYLFSSISSVAPAAVPGLAAQTFGDVDVRAVDFNSGRGPPPCLSLPPIVNESQMIGSNTTVLTDNAPASSPSGLPPDTGASRPACTFITSWALYKTTVKSLATPNYQLSEKSGQYVIDASMEGTIDYIIVMYRHRGYGSFAILGDFYVGESEGWCRVTLQKGMWIYVTIMMKNPGVRGAVRLSKVKIENAGSIEPLENSNEVDVAR